MSMMLDQALVGDVAKYCPVQFLKYHKCLGAGDASKCLTEQNDLATCVRTEVPSFKKILTDCADVMKKYEDCLRSNSDHRTKCFAILQEVRKCSADSIGSQA